MDFIVVLPCMQHRKDAIIVVVDRFSKFLSYFWESLWKLLGTRLLFSTRLLFNTYNLAKKYVEQDLEGLGS